MQYGEDPGVNNFVVKRNLGQKRVITHKGSKHPIMKNINWQSQ